MRIGSSLFTGKISKISPRTEKWPRCSTWSTRSYPILTNFSNSSSRSIDWETSRCTLWDITYWGLTTYCVASSIVARTTTGRCQANILSARIWAPWPSRLWATVVNSTRSVMGNGNTCTLGQKNAKSRSHNSLCSLSCTTIIIDCTCSSGIARLKRNDFCDPLKPYITDFPFWRNAFSPSVIDGFCESSVSIEVSILHHI